MYFFDHLGVFYYWMYLNIANRIRNKSVPTISEIIKGDGKYEKGDIVDQQAYGLNFKILGVVVTLIIIKLIMYSGI